MTEKTLKLPFITKVKDPQEATAFAAEIACVACMAELERKRTGFLRDTPEKIAFISKIHYPLWALPAENQSIVVEALGFASHKFAFKEPGKTAEFIEDLQENSVNPQDFMNALKTQTGKTREFTSNVTTSFPALIADSELLSFLPEYFKTGIMLNENEDEKGPFVPPEISASSAKETSKLITNCLRTIQADSKGLQFALQTMNEEVDFHKRAAANESERLKEKCEAETAVLRPEVDKKVKKLTQKRDKTLASVTKSNERKVATLQKKQDAFLRRLQAAEKKKDAVQSRIASARKKKTSSKSSSGSYELKHSEREIDSAKKAVKAVTEMLEKTRREAENQVKQLDEEFKKTVALEEERITQIQAACDAKVNEGKKQVETMISQAASITANLENLMDELKRSGAALRQQVLIDWKPDSPEDLVLARIPVYLIKYLKGNNERFSLFSPVTIAEDVSVLNGLRKLLTLSSEPRLKTLTRPTSKKLHDMLSSSLVERMQTDEVFRNKISAVCRANNLLDKIEFAETLNEGLDELTKREWLTSQEASAVCKQIMEEIT